jgi:hypothetical protein
MWVSFELGETMWRKSTVAIYTSLILASGAAQAGMERADFMEVLDLPTDPSSLGPRVFKVENRGIQPSTAFAPELTDNEQIQNPSGYNGYLSVDAEPSQSPFTNPLPNTITLRHEETNTGYQIATITLTNIGFDDPDEYIAGVTLDFGAIIDSLNSDPFTMDVSFTDDSITFLFQVNDLSPGQVFHFIPDGSVRFLVDIETRTTDVPEPAALALLGTALAGIPLFRRRKSRR